MSGQGRPLVVELVGLAGAGKTTLARELAAGEPAAQLGLPLSRPVSAAAQAAATVLLLLPYVRHARGTAWFTRDQVRGLGHLRAWPEALRRTRAPWVLLDHGPLFRLAQLDAFGPAVTATASFRRWWADTVDQWAATLDVVVWLDAPEEQLIRRIRSRDQRHVLREAGDEASRTFLARYRASYDQVLERVRRKAPHAVMSLQTDVEPPSVLARRVRHRLEARLDV